MLKTKPINASHFFKNLFPAILLIKNSLFYILQQGSQFGLILPIGASIAVSAVSIVVTNKISISLALATFLLVYSSYLVDYLADIGRFTHEMDSERGQLMSRHQLFFIVSSLVALISSIIITLWTANLIAGMLLLIFPLAVIFYGTEWFNGIIFKCVGYHRIKDIPYIKAFYTAFFWSFLILYANCFLNGNSSGCLIFFMGFMLMSAFLGAVFCDFKDLHRDQTDNIVTIPLRLGRKKTLRMLHLINLSSLLWVVGFVLFQWIPIAVLGLALVYFYVSVALNYCERELQQGNLPCDAVIDAGLLLWLPCISLGLWLLKTSF